MTTHGITRLRRSLDNQRTLGAITYAMSIEDMEALVREVEDERNELSASAEGWATRCSELMRGGELPAEVTVVVVDEADGWEDRDYRPVAVFADHDRAKAYTNALRSNGEHALYMRHVPVNPAVPYSWAAIEQDVRTVDEARTDLLSAADLVARYKKLAGVE